MEMLKEYLPFLIPIIAVELILMVTALVHVIKHPHYRFGNQVIWILLVVFIQIIGPVIYFVFGRGEDA
jgi:hypothetical protein